MKDWRQEYDIQIGSMKHIVSWSGGKDSTATVILAHEHEIPLDLIIMSVVWFDKKRGIYGENPEHMDWVLKHAKPLFESWGYTVEFISSERDYIHCFNHVITKSKIPERNGKKEGFLIPGLCGMNEEKFAPLDRFFRKMQEPYIKYEGIAFDEKDRLTRMHQNRGSVSLLEQFKITEAETFSICYKYGLLSPIYNKVRKRQGCWFCPNQSIKEMAHTKKYHPHLWRELELLAEEVKRGNTVSQSFKYGRTFDEVAAEVDAYIASDIYEQLTIDQILQQGETNENNQNQESDT